ETYGLTFQEYVIRFRLREAGRLLKNPNAQVSEVAYLVGFNDPSYFTKVFRRYTGVSPSQFAELSDAELDPERLLEVLNGDRPSIQRDESHCSTCLRSQTLTDKAVSQHRHFDLLHTPCYNSRRYNDCNGSTVREVGAQSLLKRPRSCRSSTLLTSTGDTRHNLRTHS